MDFTMKDYESLALHTATADSVNVQHKKPFDIADVDTNAMKLENDDWNIDSIFPLNNDFLNDFNDLAELNMDTWTDAYDYMSSPTSTGTESENDHDMLGMKPVTDQMLSPPQNLISSSSSDSGLSSDHVDFDMSFDPMATELLQQQPLLSAQIIPEVADDELIVSKSVKPALVMQQPAKVTQQNTYKVVQKPNVQPLNVQTPIQIKSAPVERSVTTQKVQYVKRIPTNVVQVSEPKVAVKPQNNAIINENVVTNTPIVINKVNGNISGIRKVIQVKKGPNQKSIILPFSLKNGTDIRSIKIIKPSALTKSPKILMAASNLLQEYKQNTIIVNKPVKVEPKYENDSMSEPSDCESYKFEEMFVQDDDDDEDDVNNDSEPEADADQQSEYPKLVLSGEEKRLLAKEGITLPAHYPLTKHEERELKRIRRKIRNKISAQDSRKRKKEYVDGLEERVKKCTDENQTLLKRIKILQTQNQTLINQMKKMQSLLTKGGNKSVQPATCLMVLLMSMALIAAPNLKLKNESSDVTSDILPSDILMEENQMQQNRRALLFDTREKFSDAVADEEICNDFGDLFCEAGNNEHNYATDVKPIGSKIGDLIDSLDLDDDPIWVPPPNRTAHEKTGASMEIATDANSVMRAIQSMDLPNFRDASLTQTKSAKNLSDLPTQSAYQMQLEPNGVPNIILNTEIDAKHV